MNTAFIIILVYFALGAALLFVINKKTNDQIETKRKWKKYLFYFLIVLGITSSIYLNLFFYSALILSIIALAEIMILFVKKNPQQVLVFVIALILVSILSAILLAFAGESTVEEHLFVYTCVLTFDGFSQLIGQLIGKVKLSRSISPNKTLEGFLGGTLFSILTAILIRELINGSTIHAVIIGAGISIFALAGDLAASLYKRLFLVKDFNNLIPGHGGILDRFDSLFGATAFYFIYSLL